MRIKLPNSNKPIPLLNDMPDPETARKLHELRKKIPLYYDDFELRQFRDTTDKEEQNGSRSYCENQNGN